MTIYSRSFLLVIDLSLPRLGGKLLSGLILTIAFNSGELFSEKLITLVTSISGYYYTKDGSVPIGWWVI
jgi:hypothetical protein